MKEYFKIDNYDLAFSSKDSIIQGDKYRITILSEILIRFEYCENGVFEERPTELVKFRNFAVPKFEKKEDDLFIVITTSYFKLQYEKNRPFYGSKINPEQYLKVFLNNTDKVWYFDHPEARNFKGNLYSLDNAEGNVNYYNGLYSTDGFASIDDSESLLFNEDGSLGRRTDKRIDTYLFMYRKDFGFCLRDYFLLTDKPPLISRYALGIWWNKDIAYSDEDIKNIVWNFKKSEIPLSVFLLGKMWHLNFDDTYTGFTFNYNLINNPKSLIDSLHSNHIRLALNIDPTGGIHPDELSYQRFKKAIGYEQEGIIPFNIFNKNIIGAYFDELIKPLYDLGIDFLWLDYNNKNDLYTLRSLNYYHLIYSKNYSNRRAMIFSRNGLMASHIYPVLYSGETLVSWKNLDLIPKLNALSANIGTCFWSHDIAGCKEGMEDPELYMRFVQLGTFSPIFRFSSKESHYYKREPWLWDAQTFAVTKYYMRLRYQLIPYLYSESYRYSKTGLPFIQPLYYRYPEIYDEPLYKNEYYFGSELFIVPITTKKELLMNRTIQRMFIPNGIWYDFKTGKKFSGGKRYVTFYKDEDYPVFAKSGAIIPLNILNNNNLNSTDCPKNMEIHIFPGQSNSYKLYEDDGESKEYLNGKYIINSIDYNYQLNNISVIIRPLEGDSSVLPKTRTYKVRLRNTRHPDEVVVYIGTSLQDNKYIYVDGNDFVIEIPEVLTSEQISISCKGKNIEIAAERIINEDIDAIISDLQITTKLKEEIAEILFSDLDIKKKRIAIKKLRVKGLNSKYIRMFIKLLEYIAEL